MEVETSTEKQQNQQPNTEALIQGEWTTIKQLQKMLQDSDLTVREKTGVANVLAFHVNTLNRLLAQTNGTAQFNEQNLGDYLKNVEPRIARHFRRDLRVWKRALSLRK